ncbi:Mannosyltransferase [Flavobacteriaceae bacterium 3519-10]|nr:Mannosyltransferase [Flavobacteriaceae bacterium 3519-10]
MKIAFDGKRFFQNKSGLGNYSRDLVRILATGFPENDYLIFNKTETSNGAAILQLPNVNFVPTTKGYLTRQLKMGIDAQNAGAEIFHGLSGELPLKWNSKPIKKIVTIHDLIFLRYPKYYPFIERKIHLWKFRKAARQADLIIAISEQTKRDIVEFLHVPEDKIQVVYQGCHQAFKENQGEQVLNSVKAKYGLPDRFILNVGTIEERKNLLNIVKAVNGTEIPLVVIGRKTKYFNKIRKFLKKNKLENQVHFLENVSMDELAAIYKLADIFVYPSLFEGFGIPVIEALFSGTPVITSNVSCLPEAGGENSVFIDPNNFKDISAKINFLLNNRSERDRRAEKGLQFVQKFSDDTISKQLMSLYKGVLQS